MEKKESNIIARKCSQLYHICWIYADLYAYRWAHILNAHRAQEIDERFILAHHVVFSFFQPPRPSHRFSAFVSVCAGKKGFFIRCARWDRHRAAADKTAEAAAADTHDVADWMLARATEKYVVWK